MSSSLTPPATRRHPVLPDIAKPAMAKANVGNPGIAQMAEEIDWMREVGRAIGRAFSLVGWSVKEASGRLNEDEREVGKWLGGHRRPKFDKLFAIPELQEPLVICLAGLVPHARVSARIDFPTQQAVTA